MQDVFFLICKFSDIAVIYDYHNSGPIFEPIDKSGTNVKHCKSKVKYSNFFFDFSDSLILIYTFSRSSTVNVSHFEFTDAFSGIGCIEVTFSLQLRKGS